MARASLAMLHSTGPAAYLVGVEAGVLRRPEHGRPLGSTLWLARGFAGLQSHRFVAARCALAAARLTVWQTYEGAPTGKAGRLLCWQADARCGLCGGAPWSTEESFLPLDGWAAGHLLAPPWTVRS